MYTGCNTYQLCSIAPGIDASKACCPAVGELQGWLHQLVGEVVLHLGHLHVGSINGRVQGDRGQAGSLSHLEVKQQTLSANQR
jgi:hypothetical protein